MRAKELMTKNPSVVTPDEPLTKAAEMMRDLDVGFIPVVNNLSAMRLEGVVTDRDIAIRCVASHHHGNCRVRDHMTADHIDTVRPDAELGEILAKMERDRVRRIPVVSTGNRLTGVIAQADLALRVGPRDPQLVEELLEEISRPAPVLV